MVIPDRNEFFDRNQLRNEVLDRNFAGICNLDMVWSTAVYSSTVWPWVIMVVPPGRYSIQEASYDLIEGHARQSKHLMFNVWTLFTV